jgi:uncharacterized protein
MTMKSPFNAASASANLPPEVRQRFFRAAAGGDIATLKECIDAYGAAALTCTANGRGALQTAVEAQNFPAVKFLIARGAAVDALTADRGSSPMHAAAKGGDLMIAIELLHHRAPVDAAQKDGLTPAMVAAQHNKAAALGLLLRHGASRKKQDDAGQTALHIAALHEAKEAALALIDNGAEIDARNREGLTPLMLAAREGKMKAAQFLLEAGANYSLKDDLRETALDMALAFQDRRTSDAFYDLLAARIRRDAAQLGTPFHGGTDNEVRIGKPLKLARRVP